MSVHTFHFKNQRVTLPAKKGFIFGIVNVTPDSFSDAKQFLDPQNALAHALSLEKDGADVIDIGGESTRPGATPVSIDTEMERIVPVLKLLRDKLKIPISIDTTKAMVAKEALNLGASIVNDVSSLNDEQMASVVKDSGAGVILMHNRGNPETMNSKARYNNLMDEIETELKASLTYAIKSGIREECIVLDPGIGFAKTREQSWEIIRNFQILKNRFPRPMMVGVSRKSFLGSNMAERLKNTLEAEMTAFVNGADMIRTHDVKNLRSSLK